MNGVEAGLYAFYINIKYTGCTPHHDCLGKDVELHHSGSLDFERPMVSHVYISYLLVLDVWYRRLPSSKYGSFHVHTDRQICTSYSTIQQPLLLLFTLIITIPSIITRATTKP